MVTASSDVDARLKVHEPCEGLGRSVNRDAVAYIRLASVIHIPAGSMVRCRVAVSLPQALLTMYRIVSIPVVIAETKPVVDMVALALLALQVPVTDVLCRVVVSPMHIVSVPVMVPGPGIESTVTNTVARNCDIPSSTLILNVSGPVYPVVGVYDKPDGTTRPPVVDDVEPRDAVPCEGTPSNVHVSVCPILASITDKIVFNGLPTSLQASRFRLCPPGIKGI
jgi:hypothetical protein